VGGQTQAQFGRPNGEQLLYHDGAQVFNTIPEGIELRGTVATNPASGGPQNSKLRFENTSGVVIGLFGYDNTESLKVSSTVHGGNVVLEGEDGAGATAVMLDADPEGSLDLYWDNTLRFLTTADGADIVNGDGTLLFELISTAASADVRFTARGNANGGASFYWSDVSSAGFLRGATTGGALQNTWLKMEQAGQIGIYHSGTEVARTLVAASGGLEIDNQATGAGFERVLTIADLGSGALDDLSDVTLTTEATGDVLYKSAGDWLDTSAISIDPAGAIELRHNDLKAFTTNNAGVDVWRDGANASPNFYLRNDTDIVFQLTANDAGNTLLQAHHTSRGITLRGTDSGDADSDLLTGDPNGPLALFYDGVEMARTASGSTGLATFEVSDGVGFHRVYGVQTLKKNGRTSRASTITMTADPDLTVSLGVGTYKVDCWLLVQAANATPDIRVGLAWSGAVNDIRGFVATGPDTSATGTGITLTGSFQATPNALIFGARSSTLTAYVIHFTGVFTANGSGTLAVHWAQNVSDSGNTIMLEQSRMEVTKVEN